MVVRKPSSKLTAALVVGGTTVMTLALGLLVLGRASPEPASPPPPPAAPPPPIAAAPAVAPSPADVRPCQVTRDDGTPVALACRTGGQDAARRFMKAMVDRTKTRPDRVACDDCHQDLDEFTLQDGARGKLDDLLASLQREPAGLPHER